MTNINKQIHSSMTAAGYVRDRSHTDDLYFTGKIPILSGLVSVGIKFQKDSVTKIPELYLLNKDTELPNAVAHIERDNKVCYAQEQNLRLDMYNMPTSVGYCLSSMQLALENIASNDLSGEIANEFAQHWLANDFLYMHQNPSDIDPCYVYEFFRGDGAIVKVLCSNPNDLKRYRPIRKGNKIAIQSQSPTKIIPISINLTFPETYKQPNTLEELLNWLDTLDTTIRQKVISSLLGQSVDSFIVFISAPNCMIGFKAKLSKLLRKTYQQKGFLKFIFSYRLNQIEIERLRVCRTDNNYIYSRNINEQPNLSKKNIVIVGLGTIGSHIAKFFVQSGAGFNGGHLTLIDSSAFVAGNIGRHLLGIESIGSNKASACKGLLTQTYPDASIKDIPEDVIHNLPYLSSADLLVDATGDEMLADKINYYFQSAIRDGKEAPVILHTWLVGNGIAAQGILVDTQETACYRCLKDLNGDWRHPVVSAGHTAKITPASCMDGSYFAYGVGSSAIAAGLATQMALDWSAKRPSPRFRTIRIVHDASLDVQDSDLAPATDCGACHV